jgi:hypothetical protein
MNGGHDMILADSANKVVRLEGLVPGAGIEPAWLKPADFKGAALPSLINVLQFRVRQILGDSLLYYSHILPLGRTR